MLLFFTSSTHVRLCWTNSFFLIYTVCKRKSLVCLVPKANRSTQVWITMESHIPSIFLLSLSFLQISDMIQSVLLTINNHPIQSSSVTPIMSFSWFLFHPIYIAFFKKQSVLCSKCVLVYFISFSLDVNIMIRKAKRSSVSPLFLPLLNQTLVSSSGLWRNVHYWRI